MIGALGAMLLLPIAASATLNFIQNGGFETPSLSSSLYGYNYRTGTQIDDWTIISSVGNNGVAQFDNVYRPVGAGNYSIQIESGVKNSSPGDSISQTVNGLSPGQYYQVSFLLSAWSVAGGASMDVTIDGVTKNFTSFSQSYASDSFDFVATGPSDTLMFKNVGVWGVSYPQIDSVSLTAVPEPTTMVAGALLLLPFGMSTLRVLRRSRMA
jgi:hypothetical protein